MAGRQVRAHIFIKGRVQGVFYRVWARRQAQSLGLVGWVRNLEDGRVELVAEGKKSKLTRLIELIKEGPKMAEVEHIDVSWEKETGKNVRFDVKY